MEFLIVAQEQESAQRLAAMLRQSLASTPYAPSVSITARSSQTLAVGNADIVFVDAASPDSMWSNTIHELTTTAPATPILAVLPHADDGRCAEAMAAGASACLTLEGLDSDRLNTAVGCAVALRRAERAEQRQTALLDAIERVGQIGTWSWDVPTEQVVWSHGLYRLFNFDSGRPAPSMDEFFACVHEDDRDRVKEAYQAVLHDRSGNVQPIKFRSLPVNGVQHTFQATTRIESRTSSGTPAHVVGVIEDVTERDAVDEALRASEELFRNAMTHAPFGMGVVTAEGRWLRVNRALCDMLGYSEAELLQRTSAAVTHPDDEHDDTEQLRRLFAGEITACEIEKRYIHKDGHVVWALLRRTVVCDQNGRPLYVVSQVPDITARRRAREASEFIAEASQVLASSLDSEEILRTIAHLLVPRIADWCIIDLLDSTTGIVRAVEAVAANSEKERILNEIRARYPLAPFSFDHPVSRVIRTGQASLVATVRSDVLTRMARDATHLEMLRALGTVSWMIVPLAARGRIIGAITVAATESGRHYASEDLRMMEDLATSSALAIDNARLYDNAKAATRLRDEVLGFVAHDLRNPLAAISRWAARLDEATASADDRRRAIGAIRAAGDAMGSLITDLMDITRLESGHLRVEQEPVRAEYLLTTAREMFEESARAKGVEFRVEYGELPRVYADPERIHQVLSNLIGNAIRFMSGGGKLMLRAVARDDDVVFSVGDTGPGISPDDVPHVFERFWQAAHSRKTGAGLGLAIAHGIVEGHRGRIWVESELGRGSTFSFTLPIWRGAVPDTPLPPASVVVPPVVQQDLRVLVVEDHPLTRSGLVQLLNQQSGMVVIGQAATGEEAVDLVPKLHPDVVIMDLSMPGMGGVEATRRIVGQADDAIVLVLTADEAPGTLAAALRAGARGYLRKTVNEDELVTSLRAVARGELLIDPSLKEFLRAGLRVPTEQAAATALHDLSERERKVLALTAQGYTAAQAGEKLFLSPKTVETYRSRAMRKLGLDTRAELVAFAMRIGLLSS